MAIVIVTGGHSSFRMTNRKAHLLRGVLSMGSALMFVVSLKYLPLADAITITFAAPLFVTAMAPYLLSESVGWRRWTAVLVGFTGVVLMMKPGTEAIRWFALLPLGAALCESFRDVVTRKMVFTESSIVMVAVSTAVVVLLCTTTSFSGWNSFTWADIRLLIVSAGLFGAAHLFFVEALRAAQAVVIAPFRYPAVVWAGLIGFFLWGDAPNGWMLGGCLLVVGSGLYIFYRETSLSSRGHSPEDADMVKAQHKLTDGKNDE